METSSPVILTDLPPELKLHILQLLGVEEIVALRQTCRDLYNLEKDHCDVIWKNQQFFADTPVFPPTFDKPLSTAKNYERLARRATFMRLALLQVKAGQRSLPQSPRSILSSFSHIRDVRVLPGGRYMLVHHVNRLAAGSPSESLDVWDISGLRREAILLKSFELPGFICSYFVTNGASGAATCVRIVSGIFFAANDPADDHAIYQARTFEFHEGIPSLKTFKTLRIKKDDDSMGIGVWAYPSGDVSILVWGTIAIAWNTAKQTYTSWRIEGPIVNAVISEDYLHILRPRDVVSYLIPPIRNVIGQGDVVLTSVAMEDKEPLSFETPLPDGGLGDGNFRLNMCLIRSPWGNGMRRSGQYLAADYDKPHNVRVYRISPDTSGPEIKVSVAANTTPSYPKGYPRYANNKAQRTMVGGGAVHLFMHEENHVWPAAGCETKDIFASLHTMEGDPLDSDTGSAQVFPLAKIPAGSTDYDFCPLSGILAVVERQIVYIYDLACPRVV